MKEIDEVHSPSIPSSIQSSILPSIHPSTQDSLIDSTIDSLIDPIIDAIIDAIIGPIIDSALRTRSSTRFSTQRSVLCTLYSFPTSHPLQRLDAQEPQAGLHDGGGAGAEHEPAGLHGGVVDEHAVGGVEGAVGGS